MVRVRGLWLLSHRTKRKRLPGCTATRGHAGADRAVPSFPWVASPMPLWPAQRCRWAKCPPGGAVPGSPHLEHPTHSARQPFTRVTEGDSRRGLLPFLCGEGGLNWIPVGTQPWQSNLKGTAFLPTGGETATRLTLASQRQMPRPISCPPCFPILPGIWA